MSLLYAYVVTLAIFLFTPNSQLTIGANLSENFKNLEPSINLIPFLTIKNYLKYASLSTCILNIVGNLLIFIPVGFLLPRVYSPFKKFSSILIFSSLIILSIELIQLTVGRSLDIDDFILNLIGALLGYALSINFGKH